MEKKETRIELKSHDDELVIAPNNDCGSSDDAPEVNGSGNSEPIAEDLSYEDECVIDEQSTSSGISGLTSFETKAGGGGAGSGRRVINVRKQDTPRTASESKTGKQPPGALNSWWHLLEFSTFAYFAILSLFWIMAVPANLFVIVKTRVECDWTVGGIASALVIYGFAIQLFWWAALTSLPSLSLWLGDMRKSAAIERFRMRSLRAGRRFFGNIFYIPIRCADIEDALGKTEEADKIYHSVHNAKLSPLLMAPYSEALGKDGYASWLEKQKLVDERKKWLDWYGFVSVFRRTFLVLSLALMTFITPLYVNAVWCFPAVIAFSRFGHYKLAEETFNSGVSTLEGYFGKDNPILLSVVCSIAGQLFYENGDFKKAKPYVDRWLKYLVQSGKLAALSGDQKAGLYCNKAFCDIRTGNLYSAKMAYDDAARSLNIPDTMYVQNLDGDVFEPLGLLGEIHRLQSHLGIAERKYKKAIQNSQTLPAENLWWSAMPLNGLAQVYVAQGKDDLAQEVYDQLERAIAEKAKACHPDYELAKICEDYATFLKAHGNTAKANDMFLAANEIRKRLSR